MTTPDPLAVRMYRNEISGHRKRVAAALSSIRLLVGQLPDDVNPMSGLGSAQRLSVEVADLITHLSALKALDTISFLAAEDTP